MHDVEHRHHYFVLQLLTIVDSRQIFLDSPDRDFAIALSLGSAVDMTKQRQVVKPHRVYVWQTETGVAELNTDGQLRRVSPFFEFESHGMPN